MEQTWSKVTPKKLEENIERKISRQISKTSFHSGPPSGPVQLNTSPFAKNQETIVEHENS